MFHKFHYEGYPRENYNFKIKTPQNTSVALLLGEISFGRNMFWGYLWNIDPLRITLHMLCYGVTISSNGS